MNLKECTKIISDIAPAFTSFRATDEVFKSYHRVLEHLPVDKFDAAIRLAIELEASGFFPAPGKILAAFKSLPPEPGQTKDTYIPTDFREKYRAMNDRLGLGIWYGVSPAGRKISGFGRKSDLGEPIRFEVVGNTELPVFAMPE